MKSKIITMILAILCFGSVLSAKVYTVVVDFTEAECAAGATKTVLAAGAADEILSVTIDSTGTDTAFNLALTETISSVVYTIPGASFTLTSASDPYVGLVVNSVDASSNVYGGYPTNNAISAVLSNASGLTACRVIVKYELEFNPAVDPVVVKFTVPTGSPDTWTGDMQMYWLYSRFAYKTARDDTTSTISVFNSAGTKITEQTYAASTSSETVNKIAIP